MKKKIITVISVIAVLTIVAVGCVYLFGDKYSNLSSDSVVATVGDEEIIKKDVEERVLLFEISKEANFRYIEKYFNDEQQQEQIDENNISTDFDYVLNQMINSAAVRGQLKEIDRRVDYDEATDYTNDFIKEESVANSYEIALAVADEKGITKEKYLDMLCDYHYDCLCNTELNEFFNENIYDSASDKSSSEQFEAYVKELVDKYKK